MDSLSRGHIKTKGGTPLKNGVGVAAERFCRQGPMVFPYISVAYKPTILAVLSATRIDSRLADVSRQ